MDVANFIKQKQENKKHTINDIKHFIENLKSFSKEEITSWLKSVKANGLDDDETSTLTLAMAESGKILNWEGFEPLVDKHSTGGIGDKVTLLFVPLIAACGINIPKLSGRGLGITGGTIDKLESIKGFKTSLSIDEIKKQIKKIGLSISSTSSELAPADKVLYAIRDVTDTVNSIPLIASSIMSKKIACGAKNIILDVKWGNGAFMKAFNEAKLLAEKMIAIGKSLSKNVRAVVTDMNEPLGKNIGNALEVLEVLEVLNGKEITDLVEVTITLAKEAILLVHPKSSIGLEDKLRKILLNGETMKKFKQMVFEQDGDLSAGFPKANYHEAFLSQEEGFIESINAHKIGEAAHFLGAGRISIEDRIDYSVGIVLYKKHGNFVKRNEPLFQVYSKNKENAMKAKNMLFNAVKFAKESPIKFKLIHDIL